LNQWILSTPEVLKLITNVFDVKKFEEDLFWLNVSKTKSFPQGWPEQLLSFFGTEEIDYAGFRELRRLPTWDKVLAARGLKVGFILEVLTSLENLERVEKEYSDF
jgi:hypothetical protein